MDLLTPAIASTFFSTLFLALVYLYLHFREKEKAMLVWAFAWVAHAINVLFQTSTANGRSDYLVLFAQITFTTLMNIFLFLGMHTFLHRPIRRIAFFLFSVSFIWPLAAMLMNQAVELVFLPAYLFSFGLFIWMGISFLRLRGYPRFSTRITGWAFILWGLHKADYPFLATQDAFMPWGYALASILAMVAAVGMVLISLERKQMENEKWARIFQHAGWGVAIADHSGHRISQMNPAYARMYGYKETELQGKPVSDLVAAGYMGILKRQSGQQHHNGHHVFESRHQRKDGTEFPVLVDLTTVRDNEHHILLRVVNVRDISEQKQHEQHQSVMLDIFHTIRRMDSLDALFPVVTDYILQLLNGSGASFLLLNKHHSQFEFIASRGEIAGFNGQSIPYEGSLGKKILDAKQSVQFDNTKGDIQFTWTDIKVPAFLLGAPLISQDEGVGILWVSRDENFSAVEMRLLSNIAEIVAAAIQRAEMQSQLENQLKRLAAVRRIDEAITTGMNLPAIFQVFLEEVRENLQVDASLVMILDEKIGVMRPVASIGLPLSEIRSHLQQADISLKDCSINGKNLPKSGSLNSFIENSALEEYLLQKGMTFNHCIALKTKGRLKGSLLVCNRQSIKIDAQWEVFSQSLATQAAIAVEDVQNAIELQSSHFELETAYHTTLEGWAKALELRDNETEGHSRRVTEMTLRIAMEMGLQSDELVHIRRGALLHDIGKMGIPDSILHKPGPLNEQEWAIMRQHPQYAMDWLSSIEYLQQALEIPYCHHEKWDGSGYPRGLKGEQIPLSARIFAVVDVWDALMNDRPYRSAWPEEKVLDYIKCEAGKHFDPQVVEVFMEVISDWKEVKEFETILNIY